MKIPVLGQNLETRIGDPIELAKELAWEIELNQYDDEVGVVSALAIMNTELHRQKANRRSIIKATHAYARPGLEDPIGISHLSDRVMEEGRIEQPILRGNIDSFIWMGSPAFSGFGLMMYGVDYYKPAQRRHDPSTFVPLEAIDVRLSLIAED